MIHVKNELCVVAGFMNGDRFQMCTTSYDYDALLTEAGDPTYKYYKTRDLLSHVSSTSTHLQPY